MLIRPPTCGHAALVCLLYVGLPIGLPAQAPAARAPAGRAPAGHAASAGLAGPWRFDYDRLQRDAASLLSEYLRINTSNPPGNELAAARWLQGVLTREGIEAQILDTAELGKGRANLYARLPGRGGKAIALVHHMDVVPATRGQWSVDPFGGVVKDGAVWGRGALDMKGHGIVQLVSLIALKRAGVPLARDVVLIGNADEEFDGLGTQAFIEHHPDLVGRIEYLLTESGDSRVEGDSVRWFGLETGEKLAYWHTLTFRGKGSHGSEPTPFNPVPRLARALARVAAWQTPLKVTPAVARYFKAQAAYHGGAERRWLQDVRSALRSPRARAWLLSDPERNALLRNTISPTVLKGSDKTNSIPAQASAELDIRLLPGEDTAAFKRELLRVIGDTGAILTPIGELAPPFDAPLDTELAHAIERVAGRLLPGVPIATTVSTGASDRPYYANAGVVCYGIDPYLVDFEEQRREVHAVDERVAINQLGFGLRLYLGILEEMNREGTGVRAR